MKLLSLFSGIGAFEKALTNIGVDYELVGFSEIDKYAVQSYCAIHDVSEDLNLGDVKDIQTECLPKDIDMITHGSPCQDFSITGEGCGGCEESGTRSSLMWETVRIIKDVRPKYVIWENVKGVLNKNHISSFKKYLKSLEDMGYKNFYQVINSIHFGVPQNRERVFVVSVLNNCNQDFRFLNTQETTNKKIKDILENPIKDKYILSEKIQKRLVIYSEPKGMVIGSTAPPSRSIGQRDRVYDINGHMATLTATEYKQPKQILHNGLVRKITPLECWRLMGFDDEDYYMAKNVGISDTQLYKQAGNSIVVPVLESIFEELFK